MDKGRESRISVDFRRRLGVRHVEAQRHGNDRTLRDAKDEN